MLTQAAKVCIATTTILGTIAIGFVALRFHCRLRIQKIKPGPDDWTILAALLLSTGIAILTNYVAATAGVGESSFEPTLDQVIFALKTNLGLENAQITCMGLIKISLLLYYRTIFVHEVYQVITNILIGVVASFEISIICANLLSKGTPVSRQWDPMVPFTLDVSAILIAFCAGNLALDTITLVLPIIAVTSLRLSTSKKLLLSVIFSLGSFCIIASIIRLYYAVQFTRVPATGSSFFRAPFIYNILWALIEPPVFILAGCLLTLGPLFRSKYGPASLFRSLRSQLLGSFSFRSFGSSKGGSKGSRLGDGSGSGGFGKRAGSDRKKLWVSEREGSASVEGEMDRELRELDRMEETERRRGELV